MTNPELLLKFGEMTRSELRLAKAISDYYEREIASLKLQLVKDPDDPCDICELFSSNCDDCPNNKE